MDKSNNNEPKHQEDALTFEKSFITGDVIWPIVGRLVLHKQHTAQILITSQGLHLIVTQEAIDAGAVTVMKEPGDNIPLPFCRVAK